jgi:hypothetical protein
MEERLLPWYVHRKGYWNAWGDVVQQAQKAWTIRPTRTNGRRDWERTLELDAGTRLPVDHPRTEAVIETFRYNFRPYRPGEGAS